ncbi:MAG TPA: DNA cytosine methyltransferase [Gemmatimonadaceae bacterium]|nr:DNA cytosine methyltransferase [Gemmatimonadaceae bacterium]
MVYAEICAGVGGGSLGLHRAGLRAAWFNEINARAADVLRARFSDIPVYQTDAAELDGRVLIEQHGSLDLIVGGTPCQDLSAAGRRAGLHGEKSIIFFQLIRLWAETQATYALWENVAGALWSHRGRDFACVLSAFVSAPVAVPRTGWCRAGVAAGPEAVAAWRVLDAQYFGVPQRRKRVFILAARTGGVDPAQVLLESNSVYGDTTPRHETRQTIADDLDRSTLASCAIKIHAEVAPFNLGAVTRPRERSRVTAGAPAPTLTTDGLMHVIPNVAHTLTAHYAKGGDPSTDMYIVGEDAVAFRARQNASSAGRIVPTLLALEHRNAHTGSGPMDVLRSTPIGRPRRLLPVECERLMGWPDGWTDVADHRGKSASDTFRYRACGNGIVSHVTQWIGERLMALSPRFSNRSIEETSRTTS